MALTLADLLTVPTRAQIEANLLASLQSLGFPISDWQPGGVEKTLVQMFSQALYDFAASTVPTITAGGFVGSAAGKWLTFLSNQLYAIDQFAATRTIGNMILDCAPGSGPYTITAGTLIFQGLTGNRYLNTGGASLQQPGFSGITHVGGGAGTITPAPQILITITLGGGIGVAQFTHQTGSGPIIGPATVATSVLIANTLTTVSFSAGTYVIGTTYSISLVTGAITQIGPGPTVTQSTFLAHKGVSFKIAIVLGGGLGVATYQFSTDGGATYSAAATVPSSGIYANPDTGVVIVFAGVFVALDTYAFQSYGRITLPVQSEFTNASTENPPLNYTDPSNSISRMVTPLVGVTASNPAPDFTVVSLAGTSTGIVIPKRQAPAVAPTAASVTVRIDLSGQVGVASWSYSLNGGAFVSAGVVASANVGSGITVGIFNGIGTPSFLVGDTFTFNTPGSWITTQGVDLESDPNLRIRDKARWPSLSDIPTSSTYEFWARNASSQVTRVLVLTDPVVNDKILVYVAGQGGILPAAVLTTIQNYINLRHPITDFPTVVSPTARSVSLSAATAYVSAEKLVAAQASTQAIIQTYMNAVDLNGEVVLAQLIEAVMAIDGFQNLVGLSIVGANSGPDLQLPITLNAVEVVSWFQNLSTLWTWVAV